MIWFRYAKLRTRYEYDRDRPSNRSARERRHQFRTGRSVRVRVRPARSSPDPPHTAVRGRSGSSNGPRRPLPGISHRCPRGDQAPRAGDVPGAGRPRHRHPRVVHLRSTRGGAAGAIRNVLRANGHRTRRGSCGAGGRTRPQVRARLRLPPGRPDAAAADGRTDRPALGPRRGRYAPVSAVLRPGRALVAPTGRRVDRRPQPGAPAAPLTVRQTRRPGVPLLDRPDGA